MRNKNNKCFLTQSVFQKILNFLLIFTVHHLTMLLINNWVHSNNVLNYNAVCFCYRLSLKMIFNIVEFIASTCAHFV